MLYVGSSSVPGSDLDEITNGIVVAKMGNPGPLSMKHGNFFTAKADSFVRDIATKEVIYAGQKPLSLYMELIQVFSRPSDWIFNGPTGIGMYGIHIHMLVSTICDLACKNQPCEHKLHRAIFLLISSALNVVSYFHNFQKKAH